MRCWPRDAGRPGASRLVQGAASIARSAAASSRWTCVLAPTSTSPARRWRLPFRSESVSAVLMLNVLHHLPDPAAFFRECTRVLKPGGRVCLIEPYVSPLSRQLVRPLHHEPWDETGTWALPGSGPMTGANMALPWIIFARDRARYDAEFPNLRVDRLRLHTIGLYLLSGGVSMRSLAPGGLFAPFLLAEHLLAPAGTMLASMMTVELVRFEDG